jgi:hypothetical protein
MLSWVVVLSQYPRRVTPFRHRNETPPLVNPLALSQKLVSARKPPTRRPLSFHALTNCPSRNPFSLTSLQMPGGMWVPFASLCHSRSLPTNLFLFKLLRTLLRFFLLLQNSTPFLSIDSALFCTCTRGVPPRIFQANQNDTSLGQHRFHQLFLSRPSALSKPSCPGLCSIRLSTFPFLGKLQRPNFSVRRSCGSYSHFTRRPGS